MSAFEFDPDALRRIRLERGLSQRQIADALGYHFTAASMYERGHRVPSVGDVATLAHVLGVPMERLIRATAARELVSA